MSPITENAFKLITLAGSPNVNVIAKLALLVAIAHPVKDISTKYVKVIPSWPLGPDAIIAIYFVV
jgi:hypothetical protein